MSSPYIDDSQRPRLRPSIAAFLDVLGFSHYSTVSATLEESQQLLDQIHSAIRDSRAFARQFFEDQAFADPSYWALKFFSDNLVIGFPADEEVVDQTQAALFAVRCMQRYQFYMATTGFFVRGAASIGPLCLTDEIIFGSALVECYRLESKASIVPRIVLTQTLTDLVMDAFKNEELDPRETGQLICRDVDSWWFVNYLHATVTPQGVDWKLVEKHKASVIAYLAKTKTHDVLPKFGWACRYHNVFCHWHRNDPNYSDAYRIDRSDENSTIDLLGEI